MRKALFGILMATALTVPALAQEGEMPESYRRQAERNQANSDRQAAREAERSEQRVERQSAEPRFERREERIEQRGDDRAFRREQRQEQRAAQQQQQMDVQTQQDVRRDRAGRERAQRVYPENMPESYRRQWDRNERSVRQQDRRERFERRQDRRWSDNDRRWGDDDRSWGSNRNRWDRGWRQDSRYDWQRYRYSNRGIFRQSPYYSPYRNYGYNRFSIGITLGRDYYSNRYWINDPWQYRLPQPYAGTRWVRYYNDVLLVDVFDGQVLDVIHDFFW